MSSPPLVFHVHGTPVAQGSKRVVPTKAGPRAIEGNEKTLRPWRATVAAEAAALMAGREPWRGPVELGLVFSFPRPASHYGTGRNAGELRASAPAQRASKPDLDKLIRAVLDGLAGVVFVDDAQVVELEASKIYGPAGVLVRVGQV